MINVAHFSSQCFGFITFQILLMALCQSGVLQEKISLVSRVIQVCMRSFLLAVFLMTQVRYCFYFWGVMIKIYDITFFLKRWLMLMVERMLLWHIKPNFVSYLVNITEIYTQSNTNWVHLRSQARKKRNKYKIW